MTYNTLFYTKYKQNMNTTKNKNIEVTFTQLYSICLMFSLYIKVLLYTYLISYPHNTQSKNLREKGETKSIILNFPIPFEIACYT